MTGAALKQFGEAFWVNSAPKFKQLCSLPGSGTQGQLLICTGYTSDQEQIEAIAERFSLPIHPLSAVRMMAVLEEVPPAEMRCAPILLQAADKTLRSHDRQVQFLRQVQSAQENTSGIFPDALASMLTGTEETPLARLYLNVNSTLVRRTMCIQDCVLLEQTVMVLYVQALLAGGIPSEVENCAL